jgi:hypothetical protein
MNATRVLFLFMKNASVVISLSEYGPALISIQAHSHCIILFIMLISIYEMWPCNSFLHECSDCTASLYHSIDSLHIISVPIHHKYGSRIYLYSESNDSLIHFLECCHTILFLSEQATYISIST